MGEGDGLHDQVCAAVPCFVPWPCPLETEAESDSSLASDAGSGAQSRNTRYRELERFTPERPILGLNAVEARDLLTKALAGLAAAQRTVIEQVSFEGLSMKEIAHLSHVGKAVGDA